TEAIFKAEEFARRRLKMQDLGISITYSEPVRRVQIGWIKQYSGTGDMSPVRGPLNIWKPSGNMPEVQRWSAAEYFITLPVKVDMNISEVVVTHIAAPIVKKLDELRAQTLIALTVLLVIALAVCYFLTEALVAPLRRLALAGSDGQSNHREDGHSIQYPRSPIREYDDLAVALQKTSDEALENINALKDMRNTLELRVEQRTAELFRLSTVASQTHNGVLIMDTTGIIDWVNDGLLRMTGYSEKDYLGQYPASVLSGKDTSKVTARRMSEALNDRNSFKEEILYYTRENEEIWVEVFCNPMTDDQGNLSGFIAIFNDVTQRRLDQLNLVKARIEAERSNEAKSLFLSTMSHEI
ncbi:MAG: PAS domain-containing protein, partial [Sneathiellales bacterium]|nr:PAS domain-containing protein [Sneathiellales bacterium]